MYERFTDRARRVMQLGCDESCRYAQNAIGTEHLLIALANDDSDVAIHVLRSFGLDQSKIRVEVERRVTDINQRQDSRRLPLAEDSKKVIESAFKEAMALKHSHVGTEHLLMGVVDHPGCAGTDVLSRLGASPEDIRILDGIMAVGRVWVGLRLPRLRDMTSARSVGN